MPYIPVEEAFDMTPPTDRGLATVPKVTGEDLALATALLDAEAERREEQYAALELLNSLVAGTRGTFDERVLALDGMEFAAACGCLLTLGWLDHD